MMKTSFIEILIVVTLIVFMIQSYFNKTSMSYEIGKECKKIKSEFRQGFNASEEKEIK